MTATDTLTAKADTLTQTPKMYSVTHPVSMYALPTGSVASGMRQGLSKHLLNKYESTCINSHS